MVPCWGDEDDDVDGSVDTLVDDGGAFRDVEVCPPDGADRDADDGEVEDGGGLGLLPTATIHDPNSTPMVTSC